MDFKHVKKILKQRFLKSIGKYLSPHAEYTCTNTTDPIITIDDINLNIDTKKLSGTFTRIDIFEMMDQMELYYNTSNTNFIIDCREYNDIANLELFIRLYHILRKSIFPFSLILIHTPLLLIMFRDYIESEMYIKKTGTEIYEKCIVCTSL